MQYVDRALDILKRKRRVTNIVAMMGLVKIFRGIQCNYELLRKHNMRIWAQIILAIKLKVRY